MSVVFGIGIEKETTFIFTDKNRVKRNMEVYDGNDRISPRTRGQKWNPTSGWNNDSGMFSAERDLTVDGNHHGSGFEFQTTDTAIGTKPKEMIDNLFKALNDASRNLTSLPSYPHSIPNPFGVSPGFGYGKRFGSYHINLTMPYHSSKIDNDIEYRKEYQKKLFKGCKVIRAIQPLIIAMIGGVSEGSVGTPGEAEGSLRQAYDSYANMGSVKLNDEFMQAIKNPRAHDHAFKNNQEGASYRNRLRKTLPNHTIAQGEHGDFVIKGYRNVSEHTATIELRFLDPFFVPNLYEVMKVIISALEHGSNVGDIIDSRTSPAWNEAAANIIEEGWNARIPIGYQKMLKEKLNIDIPTKTDMRADMLLKNVANELWEKNKNGFWVKHLFDEFSSPKVMNLNRYNWDMQFRHKYVNNTEFKTYIDTLLTRLMNIDASSNDGWIQVADKDSKITVRDLILDDKAFGSQMAAEDFEDILFLFERIGAVKLKTNTTGQILSLKVIYTDPRIPMKAIDNLSTIESIQETYFGREPEPVRPVREPVREPEPTPEVAGHRTGELVNISTTQNSNINLNNMRIRRIIPQDESDLDYNIRDMLEIFHSSNFLNENGNEFNYTITAAKIQYQDNPNRYLSIDAFWTRNGNTINIYLDAETYDINRPMTYLIGNILRHKFSSPHSIITPNTFVPNLTYDDFINRLYTTAQSHFSKQNERTQNIMLDQAGIQTLKEHGIRIASLNRGQRYFIVDKKKYHILKQNYKNLNLIKYIPYQKNIYVQKIGDNFTLYMSKKQIDTVRRNYNERESK